MAAAGASESSAAPGGSSESRRAFPRLRVTDGTSAARPAKYLLVGLLAAR